MNMHIYTNVCSMYIHVHDVIYLYVHGTYTFMNVNICMDTIQTRLYSFTTTLHFPSCNWLNHVHTLYIHVHTVYRHVHTLYMGTTHVMHVPLRYIPVRTRLYRLCNRYRQCYSTGICHSVHAGFIVLHTT